MTCFGHCKRIKCSMHVYLYCLFKHEYVWYSQFIVLTNNVSQMIDPNSILFYVSNLFIDLCSSLSMGS
jgi:hypothetical protein